MQREYDTQISYLSVTSSTNAIKTSTTIANGTFTPTHQPDFPRNITITVTTSTITAGTVTINGVDPTGNLISEILDLATDTSLIGTLNFVSVTNIIVANLAGNDPADTFIVGVGTNIQVSTGSSILHSVTVNSGTGPYTILDAVSGSTTGTMAIISGATNKTYTYQCVMGQGIRVVMAGSNPITINWTK